MHWLEFIVRSLPPSSAAVPLAGQRHGKNHETCSRALVDAVRTAALALALVAMATFGVTAAGAAVRLLRGCAPSFLPGLPALSADKTTVTAEPGGWRTTRLPAPT